MQPLIVYDQQPVQHVIYYDGQQADQPQVTEIPVTQNVLDDRIEKLNYGLQQQADAIISLADQIAELEAYL